MVLIKSNKRPIQIVIVVGSLNPCHNDQLRKETSRPKGSLKLSPTLRTLAIHSMVNLGYHGTGWVWENLNAHQVQLTLIHSKVTADDWYLKAFKTETYPGKVGRSIAQDFTFTTWRKSWSDSSSKSKVLLTCSIIRARPETNLTLPAVYILKWKENQICKDITEKLCQS